MKVDIDINNNECTISNLRIHWAYYLKNITIFKYFVMAAIFFSILHHLPIQTTVHINTISSPPDSLPLTVIIPSIVLIFNLLQFTIASIKIFFVKQIITSRRIIRTSNFISRNEEEIGLNKIERIQVYQGLLGRIFNYGNIEITSLGQNSITLIGISNPLDVREHLKIKA